MRPKVKGLHHITIICGEPGKNADFYIDVLGMRMVKKTVNHDAPELYHLFYGDAEGTPGSSVTFFPMMADNQGQPGTGQVTELGLRIPENSLSYWKNRLHENDVTYGVENLRGLETLTFEDPDGLDLRLIPGNDGDFTPWSESTVPEDKQIRGMKQVKIEASQHDLSRQLLELMDLEKVGDSFFRASDGSGVHLVESNQRGKMGRGSVHHIAFKVEDEEMQEAWREELQNMGMMPSPVTDRRYFKSLYFREPSGVLYEFATMGPGYTADEELEELGENLVLPDELEGRRREIENSLPEFDR
ncbi:VOC family protein [Candidatus Nanosalina sp. VS9-1]|uniref:VOC family protein n=1 Tax=Candidatus Nanosalina sp. VS9-1 TaxID=3388566 RepID=UPI0039E11067